MDPAYLLVALLFGTVGIVAIRHGKNNGNLISALLGLGLLGYPYFVGGWLWLLTVGIILTAGVWYFWGDD